MRRWPVGVSCWTLRRRLGRLGGGCRGGSGAVGRGRRAGPAPASPLGSGPGWRTGRCAHQPWLRRDSFLVIRAPVAVGGWGLCGVVDGDVWPRLGRELVRRKGGRRAGCVGRGGTNAAQARDKAGTSFSDACWVTGDHLPSFTSFVSASGWAPAGVSRGGERCRRDRAAPGCRGSRRVARIPRGPRCRRGRGSVPGDAAVGLAGGWPVGHSRATMASNSARSSCSSAYTSSRNSSSTLGAAPKWAAGVVGMDLTTRGQALMACWPSFVLLISILRGLARSATGIFRVRTPAL